MCGGSNGIMKALTDPGPIGDRLGRLFDVFFKHAREGIQ
jgi:hypothetical protein